MRPSPSTPSCAARPPPCAPPVHLLGSHCPDTGGIPMAARRAGNAGMRTLQLFTAVPKYYNERVGMKPERAARFREAMAESGLEPAHAMAHAAYVLNVATPDPAKWERAAAGLARELERAAALGLGLLCFHPGAATDGDRDAAVARVAEAMARALATVDGPTRLCVENTAGAGTTVGRTPDEVAAMLAALPPDVRGRAGYGLDTCHLYASGYDLADRATLTATLDAFEHATSEPPAFFHLNDSDGALGSNRDRHRLIGEGQIGEAPFGWLLADPRSHGVPLVLETPHAVDEPPEDDATPDPHDVRMLALLRRLGAEG